MVGNYFTWHEACLSSLVRKVEQMDRHFWDSSSNDVENRNVVIVLGSTSDFSVPDTACIFFDLLKSFHMLCNGIWNDHTQWTPVLAHFWAQDRFLGGVSSGWGRSKFFWTFWNLLFMDSPIIYDRITNFWSFEGPGPICRRDRKRVGGSVCFFWNLLSMGFGMVFLSVRLILGRSGSG